MKIGIMQPYFFPYMGYWQLIHAVDEYVVFDDVNYIKRGWINRNAILVSGRRQQINLHICAASQSRLIKETETAQTEEENNRLLKTIKMAYRKAPYFVDVYPLIEDILNYESKNLSCFLLYQLRQVCHYLNIITPLILSSDIPKREGIYGEDKIIGICKSRKASHYINAIGGRALYHHEKFTRQGIKLQFLQSDHIIYDQSGNEFVPDLSIIDVMMFNSPERIMDFLNMYQFTD